MKTTILMIGLAGLIILHLLILKNITYTAWPEMFSYPYLINKGFLIYKDIAHPYVPLLSFLLAIYYKVFGISLLSNQIFTWSLIIVNDLLIFFISKKLLKNYLSLVPVLFYVFLQPIFEGNMLWFDLATTPFILGSLLIFTHINKEKSRLFWFGFLLSLALLVKQQAIILLVFISLVLFFSKDTRKYILHFLLGGLIPIIFIALILGFQGAFKDYFFWTLEFPLIWLPKIPGYTNFPQMKNIILLVLLFGLPTALLLKGFIYLNTIQKIILAAIISTVLMAFPRFSYFHLQPAIAVLSIFLITALKKSKKIGATILIAGLFYGLLLWKDYRPFIGVETARFYDKEELALAGFVKSKSQKDDPVYFFGLHSLIFVLADRVPPKPWIENYVWHFEIPGMQEKQIEGFEKEQNLIIFKKSPNKGNWFDLGVYEPKKIEKYLLKDFIMIDKSEGGIEVWKKKG